MSVWELPPAFPSKLISLELTQLALELDIDDSRAPASERPLILAFPPLDLPFARPCYRVRCAGHSTKSFPTRSHESVESVLLIRYSRGPIGCKLPLVDRTVLCDPSELTNTNVGPF
jgi:hypothetical protein